MGVSWRWQTAQNGRGRARTGGCLQGPWHCVTLDTITLHFWVSVSPLGKLGNNSESKGLQEEMDTGKEKA